MIYYVIIKINSRWNKNLARTFRQDVYLRNEKKGLNQNENTEAIKKKRTAKI